MGKRVNAAVVVLALLLVAVVVAMVYRGGLRGEPPSGPPGTGGGQMTPGPGARRGAGTGLARFGAVGQPSRDPMGLRITGFSGPPEGSPLALIGVREGDVIVSCNGKTTHIRDSLMAAMEALEKQGKPVELIVNRDGRDIVLTRTEKLPAEPREAGKE